MHRGGVFLPRARVTIKWIKKKKKWKEKKPRAGQWRTKARKSLLFYAFLSKEPKSAIKRSEDSNKVIKMTSRTIFSFNYAEEINPCWWATVTNWDFSFVIFIFGNHCIPISAITQLVLNLSSLIAQSWWVLIKLCSREVIAKLLIILMQLL